MLCLTPTLAPEYCLWSVVLGREHKETRGPYYLSSPSSLSAPLISSSTIMPHSRDDGGPELEWTAKNPHEGAFSSVTGSCELADQVGWWISLSKGKGSSRKSPVHSACHFAQGRVRWRPLTANSSSRRCQIVLLLLGSPEAAEEEKERLHPLGEARAVGRLINFPFSFYLTTQSMSGFTPFSNYKVVSPADVSSLLFTFFHFGTQDSSAKFHPQKYLGCPVSTFFNHQCTPNFSTCQRYNFSHTDLSCLFTPNLLLQSFQDVLFCLSTCFFSSHFLQSRLHRSQPNHLPRGWVKKDFRAPSPGGPRWY